MKNMEEVYLWVEKYRPKNIDDMVLPDDYRQVFSKFIVEKEIPNLLLYGPPGSGKTAISRILIKYVTKDKMDVLLLNGSASTGVDIVRDHIEDFLKTPTFGDTKTKIVFIDEADYMSQNAQAALRNMIEKYHNNGRFILTCNYLYKIIDPIQSRCQMFEFKKVSKDYIDGCCTTILKNENIEYDDIVLEKVITALYPDIRKIINTLQSRCDNGKLQIKGKDIESKEKLVRSLMTELFLGLEDSKPMIVSQTLNKLTAFLSNNEVDYASLYQELFMDSNVPFKYKIVINSYANSHMEAMIPPIHFMAMVYSVVKLGTQLQTLRK
jgi:DNA polymerase III delta prime subunit